MPKLLTTTNNLHKLIEGLTPKQAEFYALWLKTGNGTKAAMEVYKAKNINSAAAIASENLRKLKNPMKLYLENRGLSVKDLAVVIENALKAEKTDITGDVHPDHRTRLEAGDRLSKWLDVEPEVNQLQQTNVQIIFTRGE